MTNFTKREILESIDRENERDAGVQYILKKLNIDQNTVTTKCLSQLKNRVSCLVSKRNERFQKSCRKKIKFESNNDEWLDSSYLVSDLDIEPENEICKSSHSGSGRPCVDFLQMSERSKRRDSMNIRELGKNDPLRILKSAESAAKNSKMKDLSAILKRILKSTDNFMQITQLLNSSTNVIPKSPEEALAFLLDNRLSKEVYVNMRLASKSSGADIWPIYNHVREVKAHCRPSKEDITISETEATVSLQSILRHTADRVVQLQKDVIIEAAHNSNSKVLEAVFIFSWGFDGTTGHSSYQQRFASEKVDCTTHITDESLFVTTCNPLRLTTSSGIILWNNLSSQSERMCRPISIKCAKESSRLILEEKRRIEEQIEKLECVVITIGEYCIQIHFVLRLTLIDGKVLNIITDTHSMQTCPICKAKPTQFNDLSNKDKRIFLSDPQSLEYGISPLHAWLRVLDTCLNLSKRLTIRKWQVRSVSDKAEYALRKVHIQNVLKEKLGLKVDMPKPGGCGTTNNGNTARRAFADPDLFADCLGLDKQLIRNLKTILIALSCHLPIDPIRFGELCTSTAEIYVKSYNWFYMSSTLHKILIHGSEIISNSVLPVGILGEEASEARNKSYKNFREFHCRKFSRAATLEDLFNRSMDTTDPVISAVSLQSRLQKRKKLPLPSEVIQLLAVPQNENVLAGNSFDEDEPIDDDEDCTGINETYKLLDCIELDSED